jgi:hypothetical protein
MQDLMPTWREFALTLFRTRDADPGYVALAGAGLSKAQQCRFAVAWCTYYNLGIAAKASELKGAAFWGYLSSLYDTAPRASERRHFRGAAGRTAMAHWELDYDTPEDMAVRIFQARPTYEDVRRLVRPVPQMGDYFVWKWCDLYEVILGVHVDCTSEFAAKHSPPTPQDGAKAIFPDLSVYEAYRQIKMHLQENNITAPPHHKRPADINEAETVCCVYKQMVSGKYDYGLRTAKAMKRLQSVESATAHRMVDVLTSGHWSAAELEQIYARHH